MPDESAPAELSSALHNDEAEASVLGSCLIDPAAIDAVFPLVTGYDFYSKKRGAIFEAIRRRHLRGERVDIVLVVEELRTTGELEKVGGMEYVMGLPLQVPHSVNAPYYARIVRACARRRWILGRADDVRALAVDPTVDGELKVAVEKLHGHVYDLYAEDRPTSHSGKDSLAQTVARLNGPPGVRVEIPLGLEYIDEALSGLRRGVLTVVGARPSHGKSALAVHAMRHASRVTPTIFIALESDHVALTGRALAQESGVNSEAIRHGALTEPQLHRVLAAANALTALPFQFEDNAGLDLSGLRQLVRMRARQGFGLFILDYLQMVRVPETGKRRSRYEELADVTNALKDLAKECGVAILATAQLGRQAELRSDGPKLADLRESGDIEAGADAVVLLWRPGLWGGRKEARDVMKIGVEKNRDGPTRPWRTYRFHEDTLTFSDMGGGPDGA